MQKRPKPLNWIARKSAGRVKRWIVWRHIKSCVTATPPKTIARIETVQDILERAG